MSHQDHTRRVLLDVLAERERQHAKWGEQNCPSVPKGHGPATACAALNLPWEEFAKHACQSAFREKRGTWGHILVEEIAEAVEALARGDVEAGRGELVQVAAVAVAWVEYLDRQKARA